MSKPTPSLVALVPFYTDGKNPRHVAEGDTFAPSDKADAVALGYGREASAPAPPESVVTLDAAADADDSTK